jgi:hypothetical protein
MPLSRKGCCYLHPKKGRGHKDDVWIWIRKNHHFVGKKDYDLDLNQADFIEKFRTEVERSDFSSG